MPVFGGVKPLLDEKGVMRKKRKPVRSRHQMKKCILCQCNKLYISIDLKMPVFGGVKPLLNEKEVMRKKRLCSYID